MAIIPVRLQPIFTFNAASSARFAIGSLMAILGVCWGLAIPGSAQIVPESNITRLDPGAAANTTDINGGKPSGTNLFHNFTTFNIDNGQTANFKSDPGIQNILGRINSGQPSTINGTIQVNGGSTASTVNLYLLNPAGMIFGNAARLDINGAFTATTARAIRFGNGEWFNALGGTNYPAIDPTQPIDFAFTNTPGSIFNAANLTTKAGQSITLVGGTVISTGDIKTNGGKISIATAPSGKYVQIKADGSILSLDLPIADKTNIDAINSTSARVTLAKLLTGSDNNLKTEAVGVKLENGVVKLVSDNPLIANRSISSGEIITKTLTTAGGNLFLSTQSGDIIVNGIDTSATPGGDITVDAGGLFRVVGFIPTVSNVSPDNTVSIASAAEGVDNTSPLLSGKINIKHQGTSFAVGGAIVPDPNGGQSDPKQAVSLKVNLTQPFTFSEDASGTVGAIISRNFNSPFRVVFQDRAFRDQNDNPATGFGVTSVARQPKPPVDNTDGGQTSNTDTQASRPKTSKDNCTPSSTTVAANLTTEPIRSAGNASSVSANPCESTAGGTGNVLQILNNRE
ncbi:filamentous hemagglutinin N-terminal domain-containing protein [Chamaesiphon sp. VAR_48_metabat_403]|uniref:two-partner secretion domain-containing protein n=1 Tax=Chamaesiphon sp. VAR_48_metabat_403 TaxID=2964700 RepID=UPI00286E8091|nr:filamentous hemagglutinin N-terminal domain-containing protein [Chamaesiphon sp. VAR_48_metabat_403]